MKNNPNGSGQNQNKKLKQLHVWGRLFAVFFRLLIVTSLILLVISAAFLIFSDVFTIWIVILPISLIILGILVARVEYWLHRRLYATKNKQG
jgi:hypothetical protein